MVWGIGRGRTRISVHGVGDSKGQNKDFCVRGLFYMKKIHFNRGRFTSLTLIKLKIKMTK